jgi:3-hydroxyacyl-CoA dehydrogenase
MIHHETTDSICTICLDVPPLNAITLPLLEELLATVRRAVADPEVQGMIIASSLEHFCAGVDISLFEQIHSGDDARAIVRTFQEAFQEIEDCPKPVVAAVAGRALGGGLELAMACHGRIAGSRSRFCMPEVKLGLNPGAAGTQRLPRLVGPRAALKMLLSGETIDAHRALAEGLVDAVVPDDQLLPEAIARLKKLLESAAAPRRASQLSDKTNDPRLNEEAFGEAEKLLRQTRPEIVAPAEIVKAVKAGLLQSYAAGVQQERESFAVCTGSLAARNKIHLFFATRRAAKVPELAQVQATAVAKAGVVGLGTMGTGIAHALIEAGIPTVARDEGEAALVRGTQKIRDSFAKRVQQRKLTLQQADAVVARLAVTQDWEDLAAADLVVEAVFEDSEVKRSVLARLEEHCRPQTIIATNTSTISLEQLARGMRHPERLVGMHFFNPAQRMPLVEVIRFAATAPTTIATAMQLTRTLGKTPVLARSREGFLVTRIFVPYIKEAFWLWQEGAAAEQIDQAMVDFGFPMGPLALIDMTGLDILALTDSVLRPAFPQHGELPGLVNRLVTAGQLGQKTAAGVYRYEPGSYTPHKSEAAAAMLLELQRDEKCQVRPFDAEEITTRLVLRMVREAFCVLDEGIAQRGSDLDVASVLGIGFPDFRGGIVQYAYNLGLDRVAEQLRGLAQRCGERFAPCSLLHTPGA